MSTGFAGAEYRECEKWIKQQLELRHTWDEIVCLLSSEDQIEERLQYYADEYMFPEDLTVEKWKQYVDYYRTLHPQIQLINDEGVTGIDESGLNNDLLVPHGVASTWEQYKNALARKLSPVSIANLTVSSKWILNHLKNNTIADGPVKGLVMGSVQSGKTASMGGLISMAADYEWNFFIILSGSIDNLRIQTRDRFMKDLQISEGIRWKVIDFTGEDKRYPESELDLNPLGSKAFPTRYVTVCLKQAKRLERLIEWLYSDDRRTQKLRIIVIDDEADQASINTAEITSDDEYQDRCAINQLIINLVNGRKSDGSSPRVPFQAMNYISYTATPYANVLNERPGVSLYPKDFICTLPEAFEYFGARVLFGNDEKDIPGLGVIRNISSDDEKAIKKIHKGLSNEFPLSFKKSVAWFLCVSSYLRKFEHGDKKCISMLIHTTSVQDPHFNVYEALKIWLNSSDDVLSLCEETYADEIGKVTIDHLMAANPDYPFIGSVVTDYPAFEEIRDEVELMLSDVRNIEMDDDDNLSYGTGIHLCVDNCKANREAEEGTKLRIVYPKPDQLESLEKDPVFIVIGGNTLSRGLTIEGLVCSYFSRNSNQADTLMQMARWFGYRKGIELLQRIWMTSSVQEKYLALTKIDMDLKEEIKRFMDRGISPAQFGPRIRNIPAIKSFRITSKKKSQQAEYDDFDFRGDSYETLQFEDNESLKNNVETVDAFIKRLSESVEVKRSSTANAYVWRNVRYDLIKNDLLGKYVISSHSNLKINLPVFLQWIEKEQEEGKYRFWNVSVIDGDNKERLWDLGKGIVVGMAERTRKESLEYIDIGSLRSGPDALADVNEDALSAEQKTLLQFVLSTRKRIIENRSNLGLDDVPLILIYRIKKDGGREKPGRIPMNTGEDIIGISIIVSGDNIGGNHAQSIRINIPDTEEGEE